MDNDGKEWISFPTGAWSEGGFVAELTCLNALNQMAPVLAHQIRQPLTAIVAYLEAGARLVPENPPAPLRVAINGALEQVRRATAIIRLLEFCAMPAEGERKPVPLRQLLAEANALIALRARQHGVRVDIGFNGPAAVIADRVQIQQVLLNLMGNAIDAMERTPTPTLHVTGEESGGRLLVKVIDNGPGLPKELAGRLFEPFVTTKANSIGIGLALCRAIVQAHDGEMWLAADGHEGATFCFTLPAASTR